MENEKSLSLDEAWKDFLNYIKKNGIATGNDVSMAKRDAEGYRGRRLGAVRIRRLLEKYTPGRYEFREVVILHDE